MFGRFRRFRKFATSMMKMEGHEVFARNPLRARLFHEHLMALAVGRHGKCDGSHRGCHLIGSAAGEKSTRPNTFWEAFERSYREKLSAMTLADVLAYETQLRPGK
jgi:hypothetical protein